MSNIPNCAAEGCEGQRCHDFFAHRNCISSVLKSGVGLKKKKKKKKLAVKISDSTVLCLGHTVSEMFLQVKNESQL